MDPRTPDAQSDINPANNRLTGSNYGYDPAGNQTTYGGWTLAYDAENRLKSSQPSAGTLTTYAYDGDGRRVKKTVGSTNTWFIYDASGQLAAEYGGTAPPEIGTHYLTTDHLGSTRLVTRQTNTVVSRHDYLPFGEEIPVNYGGRTTAMGYQTNPALTQRFTGKERDTETGLDYFGARYLSSVQGRWCGADAPFADQQTEDPQRWNLYSYLRNRPVLFVDLNGRETALFPLFDNGKMVQPAPNGHRIIRDQRTLGQKMMGDAMLGGALAAAIFAPQALPYLAPRVLGTSATGCKLSPSCQQAFVEGVEAALSSEGPSAASGSPYARLGRSTAESVERKLITYLLNTTHPKGASKARWFEQALGFTQDNMGDLAKQLVFDPRSAIQTGTTQHGRTFNQLINISGANGKNISVVTAWIENEDGVVRLVTAIPTSR